MKRFVITIVASFLLALFAERALADGRRVALVVGVGAYENVPKLPNAANDANAMADMFRAAGFEVVSTHNDTSNLEFKRAIREFEDSANDADIAVVYYAGHGMEIRETNYLIPTDAKLVNERDADDEAIPLDRILNVLEGAKRLRLVILDACRDNPFASKMKRRVATRAISAGLGRVEPHQTDTLIAYAAKALAIANDGGGAHSPFTTALLANLTAPGLDIRLAFGRVRDDVLKATGGQQEPFVYGSLGGGTVALVPARAEIPSSSLMPGVRSEADLAKSDYEIVERVGTKGAWEVYLNTHKTGLYAELAKAQLAKLANGSPDSTTRLALRIEPRTSNEESVQVSPNVDAPVVNPTRRPTELELRLWNKLKFSNNSAAIAKFIETYKSSPLIPEAQDRLATIERQAREREERLRQEREAAKQREEDERQKKAEELARKRLEAAAAKQREEAEKAKAAEAARQKAEAAAAERQREAEERARAAEIAARKHEEEEAVRLQEIAARKKEAEQRAAALASERAKLEAEVAARKKEADEAAKAVIAARAAREAEEKARQQALKDQEREQEEAKAAAAKAARETEERERLKAAESEARQREAEDRRKALETARAKEEVERNIKDRAAAEKAKIAEAERLRARVVAEAERRKAAEAAKAAARVQAERAAAARQRQAAEERRQAAEEAAAASRRKSEATARRAAERKAEQAAAAAELRRRAAIQARESARARTAHAVRPRPEPIQRVHEEARASTSAPRSGSTGGGTMMGIGF